MIFRKISAAVSAVAFLITHSCIPPAVNAEQYENDFSASCFQTVLSPAVSDAALPEKYDLREKGLVSSVKDQANYGTCWAFSSSAALETSLIKKYPFIDLSELHLSYFSYYGENTPDRPGGDTSSLVSGGHISYAVSSFARWTGPVDESVLPYDTAGEDIDHSLSDMSSYFITDAYALNQYSLAKIYPDEQIKFSDSEIKQMILEDNAVSVNIRYENTCNEETFAQYDSTKGMTNHAVLIVGWDDSYSSDNFLVTPPGNGAWLAKNSWGDDWGDNGYFWISYYDRSLSDACCLKAEKQGRYRKNYQHDTLTYSAAVSADPSDRYSGYMANIFTAEDDETISAAGLYTTDNNVQYEVSVFTDLKNFSDPSSGKESRITKGTEKYAGYHTIELDEPVHVKKGQKFSVVAKLTNPEYFCPIPVEAAVVLCENKFATNVSEISEEKINECTDYGESFISSNGTKWKDTKNMVIESAFESNVIQDSNIMYYLGNVCLKAFSSAEDKIITENENLQSVITSLTVNDHAVTVSDGNSPVTKLYAEVTDGKDYAVLFPSGTGEIKINGTVTVSGHDSEKIPLIPGENIITITSSEEGKSDTVYELTVFRSYAAADYRSETLVFDEKYASVKAADGHVFRNGESVSDYLGQKLEVIYEDKSYELNLAPRPDLDVLLEKMYIQYGSESLTRIFNVPGDMYFSTSPDMSNAQSINNRLYPVLAENYFKIYPDYDTDLYFQTRASDTAPESTVFHVSVPSRKVISDDEVNIEITDDTSIAVTVKDAAAMRAEYKTEIKNSAANPYTTSLASMKSFKEDTVIIDNLLPDKTYSLFIQFQSTESQFSSYIKEFVVRMPGEHQACTFNFEKECIIFDDTVYRAFTADGTELHCYDIITSFIGQDITLTDNKGHQAIAHIPERPDAPDFSVDFINGRFTGTFDKSISLLRRRVGNSYFLPAVPSTNLTDRDGIIWLDRLFSSSYSSGDLLLFYKTATEESFASDAVPVVVPEISATPKKLMHVLNYTDDTITLEKHEGLEYGIREYFFDSFSWQDEPVFTDLESETQYILAVRFKAEEDKMYSSYTCNIVTTLPSEFISGDLNDDGVLSAPDMIILKKILLCSISPDSQQKRGADINNDGNINIIDYMRLCKSLTFS